MYLDKIDFYEYFGDPLGYEEAARRMANLVVEISDSCHKWAGKCVIVPQNGEGILEYAPGVLEYVDGWTYDGDVSKVEEYYRTAREEGLLPYAADTSRRLDRVVVIPGIQGE